MVNPEINPQVDGQSMTKETRIYNREKTAFSIFLLGKLDSYI